MPIVIDDGYKRRSGRRYKVNFRVRWGRGASEECEGRIADLSLGGCFVESGEAVQENDPVKLHLDVPGLGGLTIWGHVVYRERGVGFGVQFTAFSRDGAREKLEQILLAVSRHS